MEKRWGRAPPAEIPGGFNQEECFMTDSGFRAKLHRWSVLYLAGNVTGPSSSAAAYELTHSGD